MNLKTRKEPGNHDPVGSSLRCSLSFPTRSCSPPNPSNPGPRQRPRAGHSACIHPGARAGLHHFQREGTVGQRHGHRSGSCTGQVGLWGGCTGQVGLWGGCTGQVGLGGAAQGRWGSGGGCRLQSLCLSSPCTPTCWQPQLLVPPPTQVKVEAHGPPVTGAQ